MHAMLLTLSQSTGSSSMWPSTIVAVALLAFLAMIMLVAINKGGIDGALKMWAALGTVAGVLTGSVATYFFTRGTIAAAQSQAQTAQALVSTTADQLAKTTERAISEASRADDFSRTIQLLNTELQAKQLKLQQLSDRNPALNLKREDIDIDPTVRERLKNFTLHNTDQPSR